jgi:hypothetical protein
VIDFEKDFWIAVTRLDPMYKPEIIRINISLAFMARARCKFCMSGPDYYYARVKPYTFESVQLYKRYTLRNKRWINRMCNSWYKEFKPRDFDDTYEFSFRLDCLQFRPTQNRVHNPRMSEQDNVIECLGCECGRSRWAFNQKSTKKRPEITNRKGRYTYPQKFIR